MRRLLTMALVVGALLAGTVLVPASGSAKGERGRALRGVTSTVRAKTGTAGGIRATVRPTRGQPRFTAAQRALVRASMTRRDLLPPRFKTYDGPFPSAAGPKLKSPARSASNGRGRSFARVDPQANPGKWGWFEDDVIPFAGSRSGVSEPSGDAAGRMRFVVSNWTAQRSTDSGATWTYINPYANYGGGVNFCCDQLTVYDPSHDRFFWLRQYTDHLEISNSTNLVNWCTYIWRPASFGIVATADFDYNHMALSSNNLYVGTYVRNGGASLGELYFRMNLDQMSDCKTVNYSWFGPRLTEFSESFVNGAGDVMYWGTNAVSGGGLTSGSGFRIFRWADDSSSIQIYDRAITAFSYMNFGGTQNCGSANGTVLNWCQRTDSRMSGNGYIAFPSLAQTPLGGTPPDNDAVIGFAFNANKDAGHPRPYVRRVYFRVSDLAYLGRSELWADNVAILYPDMASNGRGHVGIIWAWGGGSGNQTYYPGYGFTIDDDISQEQPWAYSYAKAGSGNACLNVADNRRRWGDYLTIQAMKPAKLVWVAEGFRMNTATNCQTGQSVAQVEYRQIIFGRNRDYQSWLRWYNK